MSEVLNWVFGYVFLPFALSAYASVVVSRIYQFYDAKKDAWETIIAMEHKFGPGAETLRHPWANARLNSPTQRIRYFGHAAAAKEIDSIATAIKEQLVSAQAQLETGSMVVEIPRGEWERRVVALRFNWSKVFRPWPVMF